MNQNTGDIDESTQESFIANQSMERKPNMKNKSENDFQVLDDTNDITREFFN